MTPDEISPAQFSAAFLGFLEAMQRNMPAAGPVLSSWTGSGGILEPNTPRCR